MTKMASRLTPYLRAAITRQLPSFRTVLFWPDFSCYGCTVVSYLLLAVSRQSYLFSGLIDTWSCLGLLLAMISRLQHGLREMITQFRNDRKVKDKDGNINFKTLNP